MTVWHKSSYSATGDACVEVGRGVGIRDTKSPAVHLPVGAAAWSAFLAEVKSPQVNGRECFRLP